MREKRRWDAHKSALNISHAIHFPSLVFSFFWSFSHLISLHLSTLFWKATLLISLFVCCILSKLYNFFTTRWLLNKQNECWNLTNKNLDWDNLFNQIWAIKNNTKVSLDLCKNLSHRDATTSNQQPTMAAYWLENIENFRN